MGAYIHHLRYLWTPKMPEWREDEAAEYTEQGDELRRVSPAGRKLARCAR
jgi:hypothetical protein